MVELYREFFDMLHLAKLLYDHGFSEQLHDQCGYLPLDSDACYELAYDARSMIFEFVHEDFMEPFEADVWVFGDACMDKFCRLCQEYESRYALSEDKNPYRQEIEQIIRDAFELPSYDYDFTWYLYAKERGRRRLVFFAGPEFCGHTCMPERLLDIREGFELLNLRIEKELSGSGKVLQLPVMNVETERKEAA